MKTGVAAEPKSAFSVSSIIDSLGVTPFTWLMFFILGLAMVFDGYDFMIVNVTNTNVASTLLGVHFDKAVMGALTTYSVLGMVAGGAVGGVISDRFGRKPTLIAAITFYSIFTFPQAFAVNYPMFAAFRVLAGFGVGSCIPIVTTIFSESMPTKNRGVFITFGMAFMVAGWVLAGVIGGPINNANTQLAFFCEPITVAQPDGSLLQTWANWRLVYLIGVIPLIYAVVMFFVLHETPHWYANSGRPEAAVRRLNQIQKASGHTPTVLDPALLVIPPKPEKTSPATLFSKRFIRITLGLWFTYFIGQFCIYGMNTWLITWFRGIGYSPEQATALLTFNNFAAIISNVSVGFVSDRIGRRRNLAFGWLFSIVAIVLCSLFIVPGNYLLCIALMLLFGFALNYAITAIQPIMPESYPTQIRNVGVSWAQAFARFGAVLSPIILGAAAQSSLFVSGTGADGLPITNWNSLVLVLILPLALGFICTLVFIRRETRGKSMDELQVEAVGKD